MNYNEYNCCCLVTSIIMLILIIFKIHMVDLCIILLLAAIFSITWRSTKLIQGQNIIEKDGVKELFGRGLKTKIMINGIQGIVFTIVWKSLEEMLNNE